MTDELYENERHRSEFEEEEAREAYRAHCAEIEYRGEMTENIPLDRLQEICAAAEQGHLLDLRCKVGDTVYVVKDLGEFQDYCDINKNCPYCDSVCPSWNNRWVSKFKIIERKINTLKDIFSMFDEFDKTVFFSSEPAEEALQKTIQLREEDTTNDDD